jgi:hypothetical protein
MRDADFVFFILVMVWGAVIAIAVDVFFPARGLDHFTRVLRPRREPLNRTLSPETGNPSSQARRMTAFIPRARLALACVARWVP